MRRMYSHPSEYRKIVLANYLCIGFEPGVHEKVLFWGFISLKITATIRRF